MQTVKLNITVEYRSDGTIDKTAVNNAVRDLLLTVDRHQLFNVCEATYAGYNINLEPKKQSLRSSAGQSHPTNLAIDKF